MKKSEFKSLIRRELIKEAKGTSYEAKLAEIEKQGHITTLEAKIDAVAEMIETKNSRLSLVSEDENLSELIDKKKIKEMQKEIKTLEKTKMKLEKLYEKKTGGKKKDVVIDEDSRTDAEEEGYLDGIKDEKADIEGEGLSEIKLEDVVELIGEVVEAKVEEMKEEIKVKMAVIEEEMKSMKDKMTAFSSEPAAEKTIPNVKFAKVESNTKADKRYNLMLKRMSQK